MERSTKRSPRIDDELTRETEALIQSGQTESHTDESLIKEGPLPGEEARVGAPSIHDGWADEVEARSELARWLEPHLFPARRDRLERQARDRGAPGAVTAVLDRLTDDQEYPNVEAVWEAVGGHRERRT
jgi:hypothetical protein